MCVQTLVGNATKSWSTQRQEEADFQFENCLNPIEIASG